MQTMSRYSDNSVQKSCERQRETTIQCPKFRENILTSKAEKCLTRKEDEDAIVAVFAQISVLQMPFHFPTLKELTPRSAFLV